MIISEDAKIGFHKIQHPFTMFILKKPGIEGMYFNIQKTTYDRPVNYIILNGGKQIISSKIRNKKRMSILPTLIQHSTGIISQYSTIGEKIKLIHLGKKSNYPYLQVI
jgi:hypothetical protein